MMNANDECVRENKTKSVLLKLTPTLYKQVKAQADDLGVPFNVYVCMVLTKTVKEWLYIKIRIRINSQHMKTVGDWNEI